MIKKENQQTNKMKIVWNPKAEKKTILEPGLCSHVSYRDMG